MLPSKTKNSVKTRAKSGNTLKVPLYTLDVDYFTTFRHEFTGKNVQKHIFDKEIKYLCKHSDGRVSLIQSQGSRLSPGTAQLPAGPWSPVRRNKDPRREMRGYQMLRQTRRAQTSGRTIFICFQSIFDVLFRF